MAKESATDEANEGDQREARSEAPADGHDGITLGSETIGQQPVIETPSVAATSTGDAQDPEPTIVLGEPGSVAGSQNPDKPEGAGNGDGIDGQVAREVQEEKLQPPAPAGEVQEEKLEPPAPALDERQGDVV